MGGQLLLQLVETTLYFDALGRCIRGWKDDRHVLRKPRVNVALGPGPVDALLKQSDPVESVEHVVQYAAGEEDVVDPLSGAVEERHLQDPEPPLQNPKEAFHVLAHFLLPVPEPLLVRRGWSPRRALKDSPLTRAGQQAKESVVFVLLILYQRNGKSNTFTRVTRETAAHHNVITPQYVATACNLDNTGERLHVVIKW